MILAPLPYGIKGQTQSIRRLRLIFLRQVRELRRMAVQFNPRVCAAVGLGLREGDIDEFKIGSAGIPESVARADANLWRIARDESYLACLVDDLIAGSERH